MSQTVELKTVEKQTVEKQKLKIKTKKSSAPPPLVVVVAEDMNVKKQSVWLGIRARPQVKKTLPIVWEHIEDISDDEEDTPQKAGKRLSDMKDSKAQLHRRIYEIKLDELQYAGLFLNWAPVKPMPFRMEW